MNNMSNSNNFPPLDDVVANTRSVRYANLSQANELNAVSNYIYQAIIFEEMVPALSDLFENIAFDDMQHYNLLGKLIKKLGGNPLVRTRVQNEDINFNFSTASQANTVAKKTIEQNIKDKEKSKSEYNKLSESCEDRALSSIYKRFSEDEAEHARLLKQMLYS